MERRLRASSAKVHSPVALRSRSTRGSNSPRDSFTDGVERNSDSNSMD